MHGRSSAGDERNGEDTRMKDTPNIVVSSSQKALRVLRKRLSELVKFVARSEGVRLGQVDIAVVDSAGISGVNRRFLGHARPTDVISFDLSDAPAQAVGAPKRGLSVQLVVCGDLAVRQGPLHGLKPQHELMLYVIHGLLHQMGYEDTSIRGGARMHAREEELLKEFLRQKRKAKSEERRAKRQRV